MLRLYVFLAALGVLGVGVGFWLAQTFPLAAVAGFGVMSAAAIAMVVAPARHALMSLIIALPLAIITWSMFSSMAAQLSAMFALDLHPLLADVLRLNAEAQAWLMGLIFGRPEPVAAMMAEGAQTRFEDPGLLDGFGGRIAIDISVAVIATLLTGMVKKVLNIGGGRRAAV